MLAAVPVMQCSRARPSTRLPNSVTTERNTLRVDRLFARLQAASRSTRALTAALQVSLAVCSPVSEWRRAVAWQVQLQATSWQAF